MASGWLNFGFVGVQRIGDVVCVCWIGIVGGGFIGRLVIGDTGGIGGFWISSFGRCFTNGFLTVTFGY